MDTVVLKFGGSSVANNEKLNLVAEKIISYYNQGYKVVVVVSAQGKTTDRLLKEAIELDLVPNNRELDVLLSSGEQISIAKLAILLNKLGYKAVSLTGSQAGIITNNVNQNAIIEYIDNSRILDELGKNKIVIIAGFQGINERGDITTLGRGGSDTTAIAIATAINAKKCYIFSDVDGIYTSDPNKISISKKLSNISYDEMITMSEEGAKVLHNRCIEIAKKYNIPIIAKSTFSNYEGTIIENKIEESGVKSIVKDDNIIYIHAKANKQSMELFNKMYVILINRGIYINNIVNNDNCNLDIKFTIKVEDFFKYNELIKKELNEVEYTYSKVSNVSVIGYGIMNDKNIFNKCIEVIQRWKYSILKLDIDNKKIKILFNQKVDDEFISEMHKSLIK